MDLASIPRTLVWIGTLAAAGHAQAADFELLGRVQPERALQVDLHGATTPFRAITEAGPDGKFRFRKLPSGTYALIAGGYRRTVEVGPGVADSKGRVTVVIDLRENDLGENDLRGTEQQISVRELSIPKEALREYDEAQKALRRRDAAAAAEHLQKAVARAPQYSNAWNDLGTIAYQAGQYAEAEADFRRGLDAGPDEYAPLVNLGGVLINLARWEEALDYNRRAVLRRPGDALANAQLGMACFYSGQLDEAEKYLNAARQIDPAHFSHPQLLLAQIHLQRNQPEQAADELQDLIDRHPDLPNAALIKEEILRLRGKK